MSERAKDMLCGAAATLLATSVWTVGVYAWTEQADLLRRANRTSGALIEPAALPAATAATAPNPAIPDTTPANGTAADVAARQAAFLAWSAEMDRIGVSASDKAMLAAQCWTESRWRTWAESPVGASGICQFMPATWAEESARTDPSCEGVAPSDPTCSARAQHGYMRVLERGLPRDAKTDLNTLSAYNWGPGNFRRKGVAGCRAQPNCDPRSDRQMQRHQPTETNDYRKRIMTIGGEVKRDGFATTFGFSF